MDQNLFKVKGTYVNGAWFNESKTYEVFNPSNNSVLAKIPISSPEELELAVQSAESPKRMGQSKHCKKSRSNFEIMFQN